MRIPKAPCTRPTASSLERHDGSKDSGPAFFQRSMAGLRHAALSVLILTCFAPRPGLAAPCEMEYYQTEGNLLLNPYFECDQNQDNFPDGWQSNLPAGYSVGRTPSSPSSLIIENAATESPVTSQLVYQKVSGIKPDTWYEISASLATENLEPILIDGRKIASDNLYNGIYVGFVDGGNNGTWVEDGAPYLHDSGFQLSGWDESRWIYRVYDPSARRAPRAARSFVKTRRTTQGAWFGIQMYSRGRLLISHVVLSEVPGNRDPSVGPDKKAGRLNRINYKGNDFFPVITRLAAPQDFPRLKELGFNTVVVTDPRGSIGQALKDNNLAALVALAANATLTPSPEGTPSPDGVYQWYNDPLSEVNYVGSEKIRSSVDASTDSDNLLGFELPDEMNIHPYKIGDYLPELRGLWAARNYIKSRAPNALVHIEYHTRNYTESYDDLAHYLAPVDSAYYTINTPCAYPGLDRMVTLPNAGKMIHRSLNIAPDKYFFAFGLGVYWWSNWDCRPYTTYTPWHFYEYIPFNLQRYQIWQAIIAGAAGAEFYGRANVNSADQYEAHQWMQLTTISRELASLYGMLLERQYFDEWTASDSRVQAILKRHGGKLYLLAANGHAEDINNVSFTLDPSIVSVKALNEDCNHNICLGCAREVGLNADLRGFTDDFRQQKGVDFIGKDPDAPGYAVHLYEIEPAPIPSTTPTPAATPPPTNPPSPRFNRLSVRTSRKIDGLQLVILRAVLSGQLHVAKVWVRLNSLVPPAPGRTVMQTLRPRPNGTYRGRAILPSVRRHSPHCRAVKYRVTFFARTKEQQLIRKKAKTVVMQTCR